MAKTYSDNSWSAFYANRVNNDSYMEMFCKKYEHLISIIDEYVTPGVIFKEEGCGIGNVAKAHSLIGNNKPKKYVFSDIDSQMLELCRENTEMINADKEYIIEDIRSAKDYEKYTIVVTHGVLEHFSDEQVIQIFNSHLDNSIVLQAHYVPLNGYNAPSFGDERLYNAKHWLDLFNPKLIARNSDKDLFMFK